MLLTRSAGAQEGAIFFEGTLNGREIQGNARVFAWSCGQFTFAAGGVVSANDGEITLQGASPRVDRSSCSVLTQVPVTLSFKRVSGPSFGELSGGQRGSQIAQVPDLAFRNGLEARSEYEQWFGSISGDRREGAHFWAGQRSAPQPRPCAGQSMSQVWQEGCQEAQRRLALSDARRRSEIQFRAGWNAWTPAGQSEAPIPEAQGRTTLRDRVPPMNSSSGYNARSGIVQNIRQSWRNYSAREKNILEQVLNYQTTGNLSGKFQSTNINNGIINTVEFWVSGHGGKNKCELSRFEYQWIESISGGLVEFFDGGDLGNAILLDAFNSGDSTIIYNNAGRQISRALNALNSRLSAQARISINGIQTGNNQNFNSRPINITEDSSELLDIRKYNETAFRIRSNIVRNPQPNQTLELMFLNAMSGWSGPRPDITIWRSGDENNQILSAIPISDAPLEMERLQRAWRLAFDECPAQRSAF